MKNKKIMTLKKHHIAFALGAFFYAYVLLTRNLHVVIQEQLCNQFQLTDLMFGQYRGIYFLTYCAAHLPLAYIIDRIGPKLVVSFSALLCALGISPMLWSNSAVILILGRTILGLGASAAILCVFKINRAFFKPALFGRLLGVAATFAFIVSVMGYGPLQRIICAYGYNSAIFGVVLFGIAISILSLLCIEDIPKEKNTGFLRNIREVVSNPSFWIIALIGGTMIGVIEGFVDGWSVALLTSLFSWDLRYATDVSSIILIGFAIGSFSIPIIAHKLDCEKSLFGGCGFVLGASLLVLFIKDIPHWTVGLLYFILGYFSSYQVLCVDWAGKIVKPHLASISSAAANTSIMSFGYIFHIIIALLMTGKGVQQPGSLFPIYSRLDLLIGLLPIIVGAFIGYFINRISRYNENLPQTSTL